MSPRLKQVLHLITVMTGVIVVMFLVAGFIWSASSIASSVQSNASAVEANQQALSKHEAGNKLSFSDHETRLRSMEKTTESMATDVKWIRREMEREHP